MLWVYLAVFLVTGLLGNFLIHRRNPVLLERRQRTGPSEVPDQLYRVSLDVSFVAHYIIAGLDNGRYHWSYNVPIVAQVLGLAAFAAGLWLDVWAASVNPFYTREVRIQTDHGQHVITGGPYRYVRHPGYAGSLLFMLATGPALGSWWSVLPMLLVIASLIRRTALEDRLLHKKLAGFADYAARVRFLLVPGVW